MPARGTVIRSLSGRDSGSFMTVLGTENDKISVCDGKKRPLERPKLKSMKHISPTSTVLKEEQLQSNRSIRHALNDFKATTTEERFECPKRI